MNVDIAIARSIDIAVPRAQVGKLLADLESTIRRFPKLKRLKKLDEDQYLWELSPIGSRLANIAHEVRYGAHYTVDGKGGSVRWKPIPEQGNASIEGEFRLEDLGGRTRLHFRVGGRLRDVPVPLLYRVVAPAFIQGKFTRLVDVFLERTAEAAIEETTA